MPVRKTVFEARFFAGFDGPGRYEVLDIPGGCVLCSVWDGVACRGFKRFLPFPLVLKTHLDAERGALGFPYRSGTGFIGLVEALKKEE